MRARAGHGELAGRASVYLALAGGAAGTGWQLQAPRASKTARARGVGHIIARSKVTSWGAARAPLRLCEANHRAARVTWEVERIAPRARDKNLGSAERIHAQFTLFVALAQRRVSLAVITVSRAPLYLPFSYKIFVLSQGASAAARPRIARERCGEVPQLRGKSSRVVCGVAEPNVRRCACVRARSRGSRAATMTYES